MSIEANLMLLALLLALSGIFSGTETAMVSLSRVRVKQLMRQNRQFSKTLAQLKANPHRLLITILIGNNVVNIAAAALATTLAMSLFPDYAIGIAVGITTFLILVFGEITPKSLALQHAEFVSLVMAKPILWLSYVLSPVIWVLEAITRFLTSLTGGTTVAKGMTEDEFRAMVSIGAEEGAIKAKERELIQRVFRLDDITAEQAMTSRTEVVFVAAGTKLSELPKIFKRKLYSRVPVYGKNRDDVVGVLCMKDALDTLARGRDSEVRALMRRPYFVPGTKKLDALLREFQALHQHLAVVVDEYGGVAGVITIEDVLEELVGAIYDETDVVAGIKKISKNEVVADARTAVGEINNALGLRLRTDQSDTIGGLLLHKLDRIPKTGDSVLVGSVKMLAEDMDCQKIKTVRIIKI